MLGDRWQRPQQRQRLGLGAVGRIRARQMQVAHGGADVAVPEPLRQAVQVDPGFQQVRGVTVAQCVDAALLGDAGIGPGGDRIDLVGVCRDCA